MAKLTRGGFLRRTSASAAALGALTAAPGLATVADSPAAPSVQTDLAAVAAEIPAPLVAHVSDLATGEIALMVGTREILFHDAELVARLVSAAR